ncbi:hypothetical protein B566_EDAN015180 [Ephemera danica]|nr:hypothetical protein B566_EDAN015180 [Ephemera danica]
MSRPACRMWSVEQQTPSESSETRDRGERRPSIAEQTGRHRHPVVKIESIKPEKSGDLEALPTLDLTQLHPDFNDCKAIDGLSDIQNRLYTLQFMPHAKSRVVHLNKAVTEVQRHSLDSGSIETHLARMTVKIRSLQAHMEVMPRDKKSKVVLKELIERRKKLLKYVRRWDYKRFEWLLEKLNIIYKPPPEEFHWITRKDSLRKLTQEHCDDIQTTRLAEYKARLDAEKEKFQQEKAELLAWIAEEEKACENTTSPSQSDTRKQ